MKKTDNINNFSFTDSEESKKEKTHEFNISYILIKIDDNLSKKKYSKILKIIKKIEKESKEILLKKENVKYFVYLFEIKIICMCRVIESKISESYIVRKNSLIFNSKAEDLKTIEKNFQKLKKILDEGMSKLKIYMSYKDIITESMKEHIILSYARGIYIQGKFCKLKKQIADAASFFNIGINLLSKNINKSIESETFCLFGKFLISLSCLLIEDESYIIASEKIVYAINHFIKALFLTIDSPNGISLDDIQKKIKNNAFIFSIKGLIISLFLLGISLEKLDLLDNAVTLYNQSDWIFKKFFKNIDPIFFSVIETITNRINGFKEEIVRELKNKYLEEKKLQKLRIIEEKNLLKALRLTNIVNRGSFNAERYLKMEKRLKNILVSIEKKYGKKEEEGKKYLPIIKYLNSDMNRFDFTINYLVKEKEQQMKKKIKLKNNKKTKNINTENAKTENNINSSEKKSKFFKSFNTNLSNNNLFTMSNKHLFLNSCDNNFLTHKNKKPFSYKNKLKKKFSEINSNKITSEEVKSEENEYYDTKADSKYSNILKSYSNSINNSRSIYHRFQIFQNDLNKNFNSFNSFDNKLNTNSTDIKNYIKNSAKERSKQKKFLTKNSFVFCKSFKKGIKYLQKMDKREMDFHRQLISLKDLEYGYEEDLENLKNLRPIFSKEKVKENAENAFMKIKDKIDDKYKNETNIEMTRTNKKSKEIDKILIQKMKLENSLIMGLNESKIDEIKKLEQNLEEIKQNHFIKMLSVEFKNYKKKDNIDIEKLATEIGYANKKNNEMIDTLDNEIIKCEQRNMSFKKKKINFYLPNNLKKYKNKE